MKRKKIFSVIILIFALILTLGLVYLIYDNAMQKRENINSVIEKNKNDKKDIEDVKKEDNINDEESNIKNDNDNDKKNEPSIPKTESNVNKTQTEVKNLDVSHIELIGEEEITINLGDKYTELGAKAYNTSGEDISKEIKIDSSVDTSKQGRYTVSYSIGNFIVMRYVVVK